MLWPARAVLVALALASPLALAQQAGDASWSDERRATLLGAPAYAHAYLAEFAEGDLVTLTLSWPREDVHLWLLADHREAAAPLACPSFVSPLLAPSPQSYSFVAPRSGPYVLRVGHDSVSVEPLRYALVVEVAGEGAAAAALYGPYAEYGLAAPPTCRADAALPKL